MRVAKVDPIEQLQKEAAFGRAIAVLVKEHGMVKVRRGGRRKARKPRKPKAAKAAAAPKAKKPKNPLAKVKAAQPAA